MAISTCAESPVKTACIFHSQSYSLVAADVITVRKNSTNDTDMCYTVPASKTATVCVYYSGYESAA
jgi:hypothetical protein